MVSTVGGDVSAYAGAKDITYMPSIVDVAGVDSISRAIYTHAAGIDGFLGASSIERLPTERAIRGQVEALKAAKLG